MATSHGESRLQILWQRGGLRDAIMRAQRTTTENRVLALGPVRCNSAAALLEFKKVARDDAQVESCNYRFLRFSLEQEAEQAQNACA